MSPVAVLLDKKINNCLTKLTIKQKRALLTVAEAFVSEQSESISAKEIEKRFAEYESGKVKAISLDDLEKKVRQSYKKRNAVK